MRTALTIVILLLIIACATPLLAIALLSCLWHWNWKPMSDITDKIIEIGNIVVEGEEE